MKGFHEKNGSYFDAETLNIVNVNFHFGIPQVQKKKGAKKKKKWTKIYENIFVEKIRGQLSLVLRV